MKLVDDFSLEYMRRKASRFDGDVEYVVKCESLISIITELQTFRKSSGVTPMYRVGLFWSSSDPTKQVRHLSEGVEEISRDEKHHSFIRWL